MLLALKTKCLTLFNCHVASLKFPQAPNVIEEQSCGKFGGYESAEGDIP